MKIDCEKVLNFELKWNFLELFFPNLNNSISFWIKKFIKVKFQNPRATFGIRGSDRHGTEIQS